MKLSSKKRPALVLSGGGFKAAAFHIGVCLALQDKGFRFAGGSPEEVAQNFSEDHMTFKTYVGSSAGSSISTYLAAGYSIESIVRAFVKNTDLGRFSAPTTSETRPLQPMTYKDVFSLNIDSRSPIRLIRGLFQEKPTIIGTIEAFFKKSVQINGLFTAEGIEKYYRTKVLKENNFSSLGVDLYIVATQLNRSRKIIFGANKKDLNEEYIKYVNYAHISEAIAASSALPPIFSPFGITNEKGKDIHFFDGEIRDTLSTHIASDNGSDLVIASYSIQPYQYNHTIGSLSKLGLPLIINQALYQLVQQKIDAHRGHRTALQELINAVKGYLSQINLSPEHQEKVMEIMLSKTNHKPDVEYIYIHPSPKDHEMFFADHFSLKPKVLERIFQIGFRSAMAALRKYS